MSSNVFINEPALRLDEKLVLSSFAPHVFFANSGAEPNEAAFKIARYYSTKMYNIKKIESFLFIIHFMDVHFFTVSIGGQSKYTDNFRPKPSGIMHASFNDINTVKQLINEMIYVQ